MAPNIKWTENVLLNRLEYLKLQRKEIDKEIDLIINRFLENEYVKR